MKKKTTSERVRHQPSGVYDHVLPEDDYRKTEVVRDGDDPVPGLPSTLHIVRKWSATRSAHPQLTVKIIEDVATLVAAGNTLPVAAGACGLPKPTWGEWNRIGREHEALGYEPGFGEGLSPYVAWLWTIDQAKCSFEVNCVLRISSGTKDWKGYAWLLEKRAPVRWREVKEVNVNVKSERTKASEMSTKELEAEVLKGLAANNGESEP